MIKGPPKGPRPVWHPQAPNADGVKPTKLPSSDTPLGRHWPVEGESTKTDEHPHRQRHPIEVLTKRVEHLERVVAEMRRGEVRAFWRISATVAGYGSVLWLLYQWGVG